MSEGRRTPIRVPWLVVGVLIGISAMMNSTPWFFDSTPKTDKTGTLLQIVLYAGGGMLLGLIAEWISNRLFPKI